MCFQSCYYSLLPRELSPEDPCNAESINASVSDNICTVCGTKAELKYVHCAKQMKDLLIAGGFKGPKHSKMGIIEKM